ncbi:c-type cytochrome [Sedimenticola selenatireducens]|nr:cytochrome c4 [Sedimenticola selenatireducens]
MKKTLRVAFTGGLMIGALTVHADPSPQMLSQTCAACHGTMGSSIAVIPTIAGADPEYFVESMQAFKNGERKATVMDRVAKGYSDEQITAMANYFAAQKPVPMNQSFSADKAKLGAKLHNDYCEKCHEDGGTNTEASALLAGQSMRYLKYSMEDFKAGHREVPKKMKTQVKKMLDKHGPSSIESVLNFYGSQQ